MNDFAYISADDWVGWYRNGKLIFEQHSLPHYDMMMDLANHQPFVLRYVEADEEWLQKEGQYPESLDDVIGVVRMVWPNGN